MYRGNQKNRRGFTLVEILVVMGVIGTISGVVLGNLNEARKKSNDATRITQMKEVAKAIELYADEHGGYPEFTGHHSDGTWRHNSCFDNGGVWDAISQWDKLEVLVTEGYLPELPKDPLNDGQVNGSFGTTNTDFCYGYHRGESAPTSPPADPGDVNEWNYCFNRATGQVYYPIDHEYLLYFSLEAVDEHDIALYWDDYDSGGYTYGIRTHEKPHNACLPGPRRG